MRNPFKRSEERSLPLAENQYPQISSSAPIGSTVTASGALQVADAYSCIRALVDAASSLPLKTYRRTPQGRIPVEGRGAELLRRPAPAVTTPNFVADIVLHLQLYGNAYVLKLRSGGDIEQLALAHPETVRVRLEGGARRYELTWNNRSQSATPADLIHVRGMSMDGITGLSPIKQARVALGLSKDLTDHASKFFAGGAMPAGWMKVLDFTDDNVDRLRESIRARRQAQEGIGVIPEGVEWVPVGMPLDDAEFLSQRKLWTQEICRIFRVPPWVVGADTGGSLTYSNTEQQSLHFATYSLRPWLVVIEQALSADTDLFPGNAYCQFNLDALLRSDAKTRAEVHHLALDPVQGWLTRTEVRELEDLPPEDAATAPSVEQMIATASNGNNTPAEVGPNETQS